MEGWRPSCYRWDWQWNAIIGSNYPLCCPLICGITRWHVGKVDKLLSRALSRANFSKWVRSTFNCFPNEYFLSVLSFVNYMLTTWLYNKSCTAVVLKDRPVTSFRASVKRVKSLWNTSFVWSSARVSLLLNGLCGCQEIPGFTSRSCSQAGICRMCLNCNRLD